MGVFSRFLDIVNANINSLLDKAEDPEKMIKLMMQEMEDTLIELKSSCAAKMASRAKSERTYKDALAAVERWQQRAELAIAKGRDDLAREALLEKKRVSGALDELTADIAGYDELIKVAKDEIRQIEDKLASVKQKYQMMVERSRRARESRRPRRRSGVPGMRRPPPASATSRSRSTGCRQPMSSTASPPPPSTRSSVTLRRWTISMLRSPSCADAQV